jgi:predicted ATP-dependent endonuclease of OLD family
LQLLNQAPLDRRRLLEKALIPHLDSSEARLDALQDLYDLLVTFTMAINSFLVDKSLSFSARQAGIQIHTNQGESLEPVDLSSGERQLLRLLCNTLVARENSRLFIIDEPEISLNVKWQRQLLDVLLDCTARTSLQFLVATHSIEMISGHRESVALLG